MPNINIPVEAGDLQQWKIAAARAGSTLKAWVVSTLLSAAAAADPKQKPVGEVRYEKDEYSQ